MYDPPHHRSLTIAASTLLAALLSAGAWAQTSPDPVQPVGEDLPAGQELIDDREGHVLRPGQVPPTEARIAQLSLPDGFEVTVFAHDLGEPRMLAVGPDGTVYVTRRKPGDVVAMRDTDGDGTADQVGSVVEGIPDVHGITIHDGRMYLANVDSVFVAEMGEDGIGAPEQIISGLPPGGRHPNRTLAVGPDDKLYVTVGSTCNACIEPFAASASILRADLDGSNVQIFAAGLRNTLGIGWHPASGAMWGMDNGTDWLGDREPPEELNRLASGEHYGWPFAYGDNQLIELETYPPDFDPEAWLARSVPSVLGYSAHAAPLQLAFYTADRFPAEYRGDAFVAMHGSWNRRPPVGYEVARVVFDDTGTPEQIEPFLTGFLIQPADGDGEWAWFGRPAGIVVGGDGALLVSDDSNGVIYRIAHSGPQRALAGLRPRRP